MFRRSVILRLSVQHRTAYLAQLRRAFLLRVHPDRFRHHNQNTCMTVESIQLQQASLVKALTDRMNQPDVTAWLQQQQSYLTPPKVNKNNTYQYFIEKRDGSLLQTTLSLNRSVEDILQSMSHALQKSGAGASLPNPPPTQAPDGRSSSSTSRWDDVKNESAETTTDASIIFHSTKTTGTIDTRYDVRSNRGRDLKLFLQPNRPSDQINATTENSSLKDQIRDLRNARMDAISVALQVRRTFQFAAVDATETGWSSASATVLFRRLLTFHEEYASRLHVTSFYPIRLIFSPRDIHPDDHVSSIDVYGGVIRLNPASTSIQWLETLQHVSNDTIQKFHHHRATGLQNTKIIQRRLNIKISKGFTCSSADYHEFIGRLATDLLYTSETVVMDRDLPQLSSSSLTVEPLHVVVEADTVCRRAVVTSAGIIRFGTGMSSDDCIYSIHRFTASAREQVMVEKTHIQQCDDIITNLKWQLGLQKVYRAGGIVTHSEFIESLTRFCTLLSQQRQQHEFLFQPLTGNSLGIAPTGQSCQLADDGSVVIPHNWTYI